MKILLRKIAIPAAFFFFPGLISFLGAAQVPITKIDIEGLTGISKSVVLSRLPLKIGDSLSPLKSSEAIKAIYKTGFFSDVKLLKDGSRLKFLVKQRPVIASLKVKGSKLLASKQIFTILGKEGISVGSFLNEPRLQRITKMLLTQYQSRGKLNARVTVSEDSLARNRVAVKMLISEGLTTNLAGVKIDGVNSFSSAWVLQQIGLRPHGLARLVLPRLKFSQALLLTAKANLEDIYQNRGYPEFQINEFRVTFTPDKKLAYLYISVDENDRYKFGSIKITGDKIPNQTNLPSLEGKPYNREEILNMKNQISRSLSRLGFANAKVVILPTFVAAKKEVEINYVVTLGGRVYVRRINFHNNLKNNDSFLRTALTQYEGSLYSPEAIESSKANLIRQSSGGVADVSVHAIPVEGDKNKVDLDFNITEMPSPAKISLGVSFAASEGFSFNGGFMQNNFLGTGKVVSLDLERNHSYFGGNASLYTPHIHDTNISQSFSLYGNYNNTSSSNIIDYQLSNFGLGVARSYDLTANSLATLGVNFDKYIIKLSDSPSDELNDFVAKYSTNFNQLPLKLSWSRSTLNRVVLPTKGTLETLSFLFVPPFPINSPNYYTLKLGFLGYHAIDKKKRFLLGGAFNLGYGDGYGSTDKLPFFANFFSGGIGDSLTHFGMLRGYESKSFGPRDSSDSIIGGNFLLSGTTYLIIPNPLSTDVRSSIFLDAATVDSSIDLSGMRYTTGLEIDWFTPLGISLNFTFAKPLNSKANDLTSFFQFNMGVQF